MRSSDDIDMELTGLQDAKKAMLEALAALDRPVFWYQAAQITRRELRERIIWTDRRIGTVLKQKNSLLAALGER